MLRESDKQLRDRKHELMVAHLDELHRIHQQGHTWQHAVDVFAGRRSKSWVYDNWPETDREFPPDYSTMDISPRWVLSVDPMASRWRQP